MSFLKLRERLESLSGQVRPDKQLQTLNPACGLYQTILNGSVDNTDGLVEQVVAVLSAIPQLSPYNEGYVRRSPYDESSVKLATIANWLLAQIRLRAPDQVVAHLEEFVASDCAPMSEIIALWGLNPVSPIKLTDDVCLVSIADLIPSNMRDTVTGIAQNLNAVGSALPRPTCTAALKRDFVHKEIRCKEGRLSAIAAAMSAFLQGDIRIADLMQRQVEAMAEMKKPDPDTIRMKEIARCLCLLRDSSVCELAHWYESPLSTPIIGGVPGSALQAMEHIFHFAAEPQSLDESSARSIVEGFLKLSNADRGRLYVPLSRLNTALREGDNSDKALDLGIALESLLMGDDDQVDLSYKVRQRGTFFLGGTPDEMRQNYNRLKKIYVLRSKVAHGKSIESSFTLNGRQTSTDEFLKECCIICARLIRKFIESGLVSDWDERLLGLSKN
jgi:hypothetical protein